MGGWMQLMPQHEAALMAKLQQVSRWCSAAQLAPLCLPKEFLTLSYLLGCMQPLCGARHLSPTKDISRKSLEANVYIVRTASRWSTPIGA